MAGWEVRCNINSVGMHYSCVASKGAHFIGRAGQHQQDKSLYIGAGPESSEQTQPVWPEQPVSPGSASSPSPKFTGSESLTCSCDTWKDNNLKRQSSEEKPPCRERHLQRWHKNERRKCLFTHRSTFKCITSAHVNTTHPPFKLLTTLIHFLAVRYNSVNVWPDSVSLNFI